VRAVDAGAVGTSPQHSRHQVGIRGRRGRHRDHDAGPRPLGICTEQADLFALDGGLAGTMGPRRPPRTGRQLMLTGHHAQRGENGIEGRQHARLALPERRQAKRRQAELQVAHVAPAQGQVVREVQRGRREPRTAQRRRPRREGGGAFLGDGGAKARQIRQQGAGGGPGYGGWQRARHRGVGSNPTIATLVTYRQSGNCIDIDRFYRCRAGWLVPAAIVNAEPQRRLVRRPCSAAGAYRAAVCGCCW
jgi:hypothetical protein